MRTYTLIALAVLLASAGLTGTAGAASAGEDIDPVALYALGETCSRLGAAEQITCHVEATIDRVDAAGLKTQVSRSMDVALRRPDRLAMHSIGTEGRRGFRYDGQSATLYNEDVKFFSTVTAASTLDGTLDLLREEYGFTFPMTDLIRSDPRAVLLEGVTEGRYLGVDSVDGVTCHHMAFRQPDADWQIWIEDSIWFYPRKLLVTYKNEEGSPQHTALFSEWDYGASLTDAMFRFEAPPEAVEVRWKAPSE